MFSMRIAGEPIPGRDVKMGRTPPGSIIQVDLIQVEGNLQAQRLANLVDLLPLDSGVWVEVQIPFDLSDLAIIDSCGDTPDGVIVRPAIYVTNSLGNNQGGLLTGRHFFQMDNFCFHGTIVAVDDPNETRSIRLFPNPTTGELTLEFIGATPQAGVVQILDLLGKALRTETLPPGRQAYQLSIGGLPAGVYFVKVMDGDEQVWAQKVVKQ